MADEASARKTDIKLGLAAVAGAEKAMLPVLKQIETSNPKDMERYEFSLTQAIETTTDSLDLAEQDLGKRGSDVEKREAAQKKAIEAEMTPIEKEGQQAADAKKKVARGEGRRRCRCPAQAQAADAAAARREGRREEAVRSAPHDLPRGGLPAAGTFECRYHSKHHVLE